MSYVSRFLQLLLLFFPIVVNRFKKIDKFYAAAQPFGQHFRLLFNLFQHTCTHTCGKYQIKLLTFCKHLPHIFLRLLQPSLKILHRYSALCIPFISASHILLPGEFLVCAPNHASKQPNYLLQCCRTIILLSSFEYWPHPLLSFSSWVGRPAFRRLLCP